MFWALLGAGGASAAAVSISNFLWERARPRFRRTGLRILFPRLCPSKTVESVQSVQSVRWLPPRPQVWRHLIFADDAAELRTTLLEGVDVTGLDIMSHPQVFPLHPLRRPKAPSPSAAYSSRRWCGPPPSQPPHTRGRCGARVRRTSPIAWRRAEFWPRWSRPTPKSRWRRRAATPAPPG